MTWDVYALRAPRGARSVEQIPEGYVPPDVGAPEDVLDAVEGMFAPIASDAKVKLTVLAELDPPPPPVIADPERLLQAIGNLTGNAIKFTPAGGTVRLLAAPNPEGGLDVEVRDTGIGIAPADQARLFQPFAQVDSTLARRYSGSGLGLYLSRALAEAQGARLALESAPGEGTAVRLSFPAASLVA